MSPTHENAFERWPDSECKRVFLEHYPRIVNVLLRLLGDPMRAEEVATDAFWRLFQQPALASSADNVSAWLYRTATNLGIDALRASARRLRYEQAANREALNSPSDRDPLEDVIAEEKRARVRAVLASVRPAPAQLLILRASGLSYKELGEVLGIKASGIGTMLNRAEAEFRARYLELYGNEEGI